MDKQMLLKEIQEYVRINLEHIQIMQSPQLFESDCNMAKLDGEEIDDFISRHRKPSLQELLFHYIDKSGESDADIYNRAGIDRKHFSKIRSNPLYHPKKIQSLRLLSRLNWI